MLLTILISQKKTDIFLRMCCPLTILSREILYMYIKHCSGPGHVFKRCTVARRSVRFGWGGLGEGGGRIRKELLWFNKKACYQGHTTYP